MTTKFLLPMLALAATLALPSCATAPPIVNDVVTCGGSAVQPSDVTEVYNDLSTSNWTDLTAVGVRLGWDIVACVIDDLTSAHPALKPAGDKFKADHAEQIARARRPSTSMLRQPSLQKISDAPPPAASGASPDRRVGGTAAQGKPGVATRSGGSFELALLACDARCGAGEGLPVSDGTGCICHVAARRGKPARWVAAK